MLKAAFAMATVVFLAEVGCLLRSAALVAQYGKTAVLLGTIIGTAAAAVVGVYMGEWASKALPDGVVRWASGLTLVAIGVWMLAQHHNHAH